MHTMAKVKNAALADDDKPGKPERVLGEEQVVASSDQLVANTDEEAQELVALYDADPSRVATVSPGVDLSLFRPESPILARSTGLLPHRTGPARRRLGLPRDAYVLLFVGRIQPLKAPDVLLRAVARMLADDPALRSKLVVAVVGGPSGSGRCRPEGLQRLAAHLGISDVMRFEPPSPSTSWPTGTGPRTSPSSRPTASRSGSSPSSRRHAGRPSSPPASAACARPSRTASPAC